MNISANEFHYLMQALTTELLTLLTEEHGLTLTEACDVLYHSRTFAKLTDSGTGLYSQSPRYILSYLLEEGCVSDTKTRSRDVPDVIHTS